jgi:hypothetical protein
MGMGGQRHVPAALHLGNKAGTHCPGGWLGLGDGLGVRETSRTRRGSNLEPSSP